MADTSSERRHLWRHLIQCVLAEQDARELVRTAPTSHRLAAAEKRLAAEGIRLDAAIDALDETLTPDRRIA